MMPIYWWKARMTLFQLLNNSSEGMGLKLFLQKTTVMSTVEKVNIFSDGENIRTVTNCKVLVVLITNYSYTNEEAKKRKSLRKPAMGN